jgi:hypothetical protein
MQIAFFIIFALSKIKNVEKQKRKIEKSHFILTLHHEKHSLINDNVLNKNDEVKLNSKEMWDIIHGKRIEIFLDEGIFEFSLFDFSTAVLVKNNKKENFDLDILKFNQLQEN